MNESIIIVVLLKELLFIEAAFTNMLPAQTIDFTRGDTAPWILFVVFPLIFILKSLEGFKNFKERKRQFFGTVILYGLIGTVLPLVFVGLLTLWQCFGPQYILRMQITDEKVVLGFHWPNPDRVLSIKTLTKVSSKREGGRSPCTRIMVETASERFISFGFKKLLDDESEQIQKLRAKVTDDQAHD